MREPNFFPCVSLDEAHYMFQEDLEIWPKNTSLEWTDPETLVPCSMRRSNLGNWCGYVVLKTEMIQTYGLTEQNLKDLSRDLSMEVHGGLTYESRDPDTDDLIYGFDCAHAGDFLPQFEPKESQNKSSQGKISDQSTWTQPTSKVYHVWVKAGVDREVTHMAERLWTLVKLYGSS